MKNIKRIFTILLVTGLLCGCRENHASEGYVPALVRPVATGESFFPVMLGDIGMPTIVTATVKCREYGQTYTENQYISSIEVKVGDYVREGDVLAYADLEDVRLRLSQAESDLAYENEIYEINRQIAVREFERDKIYAGVDINVITAEYQENEYYEQLQHERYINNINEKIKELQEIISRGTLYADHSGNVVYTKNLNVNNYAASTENIVVIDDTNDKYLESDISVESLNKVKNKDKRFLYYNQRKIPVSQMEYSGSELVMARLYGVSPMVRFTFENIDELELGDSLFIYMVNEEKSNVKIVNSSSVFGDEEKYVYVRQDDGSKEKRYITIGSKNNNYTEVVSGLEEGEMVALEFEELVPTGENFYHAEYSSLNIDNNAYVYDYSESDKRKYVSEYEGMIVEVSEQLKKGANVSEGDYLYTIDIGKNNADILESNYAIIDAENNYRMMIETYDKERYENAKAYNESSDYSYGMSLLLSNEIIEYKEKLLGLNYERELQILKKDYEEKKQICDENGYVRVYAKVSGKLDSTSIKAGDKIKKGENTHSISFVSGGDLKIIMKAFPENVPKYIDSQNLAEIGEVVRITVGNDVYTGKSIGYYGHGNMLSVPYFGEKNDKTVISFVADSGFNEYGFYVRLDDSAAIERIVDASGVAIKTGISYPCIHMENIIVLPNTKMVKDLNSMNKQPYVWVEKDGYIYKKYVIVDNEHKDPENKSSIIILSGIDDGEKIVY